MSTQEAITFALAIALLAVLWRLLQQRRSMTPAETQAVLNSWQAMIVPMREEIDRNRAELNIYREWANGLVVQLQQNNIKPMTLAQAADKAGVVMSVFEDDESEFRHKLILLFNIEEINNLAREIRLNPDELRGSTLTERAADLIDQAHKRNRIVWLKEIAHEQRPEAQWITPPKI